MRLTYPTLWFNNYTVTTLELLKIFAYYDFILFILYLCYSMDAVLENTL